MNYQFQKLFASFFVLARKTDKLTCVSSLIFFLFLNVAPIALGQNFRLTQPIPRQTGNMKPPSVPFSQGPVIPGLRQGAVPQGLTFIPTINRWVISNYFDKSPSCLTLLDGETGEMVTHFTLADATGKVLHGHVGGVTFLNESLFVASDGTIFQYRIEDISLHDRPQVLPSVGSKRCETKASFCTATTDLLLVGEFAYGKNYKTSSTHHLKDRKGVNKYAWVCGYAKHDLLGKPTCALSVRQRVQGMSVDGNRIFLSLSYGRKNRSTIVAYQNPIGEKPHKMVKTQAGEDIPLWFLDGENYIDEVDFPPMSEGIVMFRDKLAVLSESGATKYQSGGKGPLDNVVFLNVD